MKGRRILSRVSEIRLSYLQQANSKSEWSAWVTTWIKRIPFNSPIVHVPPTSPTRAVKKPGRVFRSQDLTCVVFRRWYSCFEGNFLLKHHVFPETRVNLLSQSPPGLHHCWWHPDEVGQVAATTALPNPPSACPLPLPLPHPATAIRKQAGSEGCSWVVLKTSPGIVSTYDAVMNKTQMSSPLRKLSFQWLKMSTSWY